MTGIIAARKRALPRGWFMCALCKVARQERATNGTDACRDCQRGITLEASRQRRIEWAQEQAEKVQRRMERIRGWVR